MKKITLKPSLLFCLLCIPILATAQERRNETNHGFPFELTPENQGFLNRTGFVRCTSVEYEKALQEKFPERANKQQFEEWLAPKALQVKQDLATNRSSMVLQTLPIVFHILTDGAGTDNVSATLIQAQIDQLNIDFRNNAGSTNGVAADAELEFCPAQTDPAGAPMTEPGINRITTYGQGPFGMDATFENIKADTQWDPTLYCNIWVAPLGGGLLGWAQFPDSSGLGGLNPSGGPASSDGVVVLSTSVGSVANPNPAGGQFGAGRTLTHELGHWLGLRHIWGDGNCNVDDFCNDTPNQGTDSGGCPVGQDSCTTDSLPDMVENYMDYSTDNCMDIFTADQVTRMLTVMSNSPRRGVLTSSTTCNSSTTPIVTFSSMSPGNINEGSDCTYQDITIDLSISLGATAAATVNLVPSGSATLNEDYELMNNSVTFVSGATAASNPIVLRVYNDSFVEADETIILTMNLSTTGDATVTTNAYTATIINDDATIAPLGNQVLFSDGFESYNDFQITPIGGWTLIDNDGDATYPADNTDFLNESYTGSFIVFNPSATTPASNAGWDPHTGDKGYYCFNAAGTPPQNDDYAITPQIALAGTGSELKFWAKSLTDNYAGGERFQVGISTTDTNASSFTFITPAPYVVPPLTWTEYTYDLSAYDGQNIYVAIHVVSADEFVFMLDDISITANVPTTIQTAVNTVTAANNNLNSTGDAFFVDTASDNLMLDIDNTGGFDYGCTTVAVSRGITSAGADAVAYNGGTDVTGFVTAKTFDITTANTDPNNATTVSFYFTEAEIAAWETATTNNRSTLFVKNENTGEVAAVTISAFGAELKLTAPFTSGLAGTYYFGSQLDSLSTSEFELANSLSIFPNPASHILSIKVSDNSLPNNYTIYNMLGQSVINKTINTETDLLINTSAYSNGMYFIKISKDSRSISIPFIKE